VCVCNRSYPLARSNWLSLTRAGVSRTTILNGNSQSHHISFMGCLASRARSRVLAVVARDAPPALPPKACCVVNSAWEGCTAGGSPFTGESVFDNPQVYVSAKSVAGGPVRFEVELSRPTTDTAMFLLAVRPSRPFTAVVGSFNGAAVPHALEDGSSIVAMGLPPRPDASSWGLTRRVELVLEGLSHDVVLIPCSLWPQDRSFSIRVTAIDPKGAGVVGSARLLQRFEGWSGFVLPSTFSGGRGGHAGTATYSSNPIVTIPPVPSLGWGCVVFQCRLEKPDQQIRFDVLNADHSKKAGGTQFPTDGEGRFKTERLHQWFVRDGAEVLGKAIAVVKSNPAYSKPFEVRGLFRSESGESLAIVPVTVVHMSGSAAPVPVNAPVMSRSRADAWGRGQATMCGDIEWEEEQADPLKDPGNIPMHAISEELYRRGKLPKGAVPLPLTASVWDDELLRRYRAQRTHFMGHITPFHSLSDIKDVLVGSKGRLFVDSDFPPGVSSLVFEPEVTKRIDASKIEWKRPQDIVFPRGGSSRRPEPRLFVEGTAAADVVQGKIGNCFAMSAVAAVAPFPGIREVVKAIGTSRDGSAASDLGLYVVRFLVQGQSVQVLLDDWLPVWKESGTLCFSRPPDSQPGELWVPLLEKAMAKLCGCYEALVGGWGNLETAGVMHGLGCRGIREISWGGDASREEEVWRGLCGEDLLGTVHAKSPLSVVAVAHRWAARPDTEGYTNGHDYTVLKTRSDKRVLIRDPQGAPERWIPIREFVLQFDAVTVGSLSQSEGVSVCGEWRSGVGGGISSPSFSKNPRFRLELGKGSGSKFIQLDVHCPQSVHVLGLAVFGADDSTLLGWVGDTRHAKGSKLVTRSIGCALCVTEPSIVVVPVSGDRRGGMFTLSAAVSGSADAAWVSPLAPLYTTMNRLAWEESAKMIQWGDDGLDFGNARSPGGWERLLAGKTLMPRSRAPSTPPRAACLTLPSDGVLTESVPRFSLHLSSSFSLEAISPDQVRAGRLEGFDLVLCPGGMVGDHVTALGDEGLSKIREFVQHGGGYLGVCAGAFLACADRLALLPLVAEDREHWRRGIGDVQCVSTFPGAHALNLPSQAELRYANGPLMVLPPDQRGILRAPADLVTRGPLPLLVFASELCGGGAAPGVMHGKVAAWAGRFLAPGTRAPGGRVILCAPHPELTRSEAGARILQRMAGWCAGAVE
jgi:hypothetical protein